MRALMSLTVLATTLTLASCSGDTLTPPRPATLEATPTAASANRALVARPMSGQCVLTLLASVPYPAPPVFRQLATGTCELTHLGHVTVHFVQVVNFAARTQQSLELTYTAANGDVLRAASAGTSVPTATGVNFSATITFLGGTGRFTDATGEAHAEGSADLAAGTSGYALDGWITYDATDRSSR
jgi:hypothetical protein